MKSTRPKAAETVEEIRFYLEHGMPEQASAAFEKLQAVTNDETILSAMEAEIQAASQPAPAAGPAEQEEVAALEAVAEITVDEPSEEDRRLKKLQLPLKKLQ